MSGKRIGELLLERGVISRAQLEAGLEAQKRTRQRLGTTLVQQGVLSEGQLAGALAVALSVPAVDLARVTVDWSAVHMLRARFCESNEVFPFGIDGKSSANKRLLVAMADPLNRAALDEIEFTTGLKTSACVATHSQLREAIWRYYHKVGATPAATGSVAGTSGVTVKLVPTRSEDDDVVMGEEIISVHNVLPPDVQAPPPKKRLEASVSRDLEFLFGNDSGDGFEKLERRFWALLRVLQRKGLVTREEVLLELGEE